MELIEIKRGFWLRKGKGDWWWLHYGLPIVTCVQAENESDALVQLTRDLRMLRDDAPTYELMQLYASAITWVESYRQ